MLIVLIPLQPLKLLYYNIIVKVILLYNNLNETVDHAITAL